ncbi:MAG: helix-turn-helix domain-containing protein [Segniliparus sp.]|uniref:helix-turn-helix domain-containing protein n=1 Tax=Segniliparus sp. TaxID=2804064 RepID=UPI003F2DAE26
MPVRPTGVFDAARLREAREHAGLTRAALARDTGASPDMVALWEDQGVVPTPAKVKRLAVLLGLEVEDLFQPLEGASGLVMLRARAGLSQRALAKKLGVSQAHVSRWERGVAVASVEQSEAMAEILGADLMDVVAAVDIRPAPGPRGPSPDNPKRRDDDPALHLVLVFPWEYENDELVRFAAQPSTFYSPQGDLAGPDAADGLDPTRLAARMLSYAYAERHVHTHVEARVVMDGELVYSIRYQIRPTDATRRELLFRALAAVLTPKPPNTVGNDDPAVRAALRRELFPLLPESTEGAGRLIVAALSTDPMSWLGAQTPAGGSLLAVFQDDAGKIQLLGHRDGQLRDGWGWKSHDQLGLTPDSTLGETIALLQERRS